MRAIFLIVRNKKLEAYEIDFPQNLMVPNPNFQFIIYVQSMLNSVPLKIQIHCQIQNFHFIRYVQNILF